MRAGQRRAAGPGLLCGLQPPEHRTGRPPQPGPAKTRLPPPRGAQGRKGPRPASSGPHTAAQRPLCPSAGADSGAWACSPVVGESRKLRASTLVGERWRHTGGGVLIPEPGLTPALASARFGRGKEKDFPRPQGNPARRGSLQRCSGFWFAKTSVKLG